MKKWLTTPLSTCDKLRTFHFIGDPVLHLDVHKEHCQRQWLVVFVAEHDVPEAGADGIDREGTLTKELSVVIGYRHTEHGNLR